MDVGVEEAMRHCVDGWRAEVNLKHKANDLLFCCEAMVVLAAKFYYQCASFLEPL